LQNYRVDLETRLAGPQIPAGLLTLKGQGNLQQFTVKSLRTKILKGTVKATGQVSWEPKLAAQVNLNADKITIKDFWTDWPDNLRLNSQLKAKLYGDTFKISTLKVNIPQTAAQLSLKGEGTLADDGPRLNLNADKITIKDFWIDWPNHLRLHSHLVAKVDGDTFKISTLKVNIPQTAAQLYFKGKGSLTDKGPRFKNATLAWQRVQWPLNPPRGGELLFTSKKGRVNLSGSLQNYRVDLETRLAGPQIPAGLLTLKGQGNLQQFTKS
ncbi:MAG: hypothetical protein B6247_28285, partial [Candidatus Parabeggiatoa sp. nov. 2]